MSSQTPHTPDDSAAPASPPKRRARFALGATLSTRLAVLFLVAALPALALAFWTTRDAREHEVDADLGTQVLVDFAFGSVAGTVTGIISDMSSNGFTTVLVLNTRCPRLFGYFNFGAYVYVGTDGAGVWRKPIEFVDTWENFSQGLGDLHIVDLAVANATLACVTEDGRMYTRYPSNTAWVQVTGFSTIDELTELPVAGTGRFSSCAIDRVSGEVFGGYNVIPPLDYVKSWVISKPGRTSITSTNVVISGVDNSMGIYSMDHDGDALYLTTINPTAPSGLYNHMQNRVTNWDNSYMQDQEFTNYTGHINMSNSIVEPKIVQAGQIYTYTFTEGDYVYDEYFPFGNYAGLGKWQISTGQLVDYLAEEEGGPNIVNYFSWYPYGVQASPGVIWFNGDTNFDNTDFAVAKLDFNTHTYTKIQIKNYVSDDYYYTPYHMQVIGTTLFTFYSDMLFSGSITVYAHFRCVMIDLTTDTITGDYIIVSGTDPNADLSNADTNLAITTVDDTIFGVYGYENERPPENVLTHYITFTINTSGIVYTSPLTTRNRFPSLYDILDFELATLYPDYNNHCAVFCYAYQDLPGDECREIRQINKDSTSYRKPGSFPLYTTADSNNPRYAWYTMVAGKDAVFPVGDHGSIVLDPYGINYLHVNDDAFWQAPVLEDATGAMLYISNRTDGQFITRAFFDYPANSKQDIIEINWSIGNGYNSLNPLGDKIYFNGRYISASANGLCKLLEYRDDNFTHVANVHKETHVDTSFLSFISAFAGDEDLNSGEIFIYDKTFLAPLVVVPGGNVLSVRTFIDLLAEPDPIVRQLYTVQGSSWIYQIINPIDYSLPEQYIALGGEVRKLETTNTQSLPYTFASVVTDRNRFYQRDSRDAITDPDEGFTDRTNNLPDVEITVIRVDDRI